MKKILTLLLALSMLIALCACGTSSTGTASSASASTSTTPTGSGVEDGVLTIAMECAYAPYNWTQSDASNGAVPIKDSSDYVNGYDIMMAKKICKANNWKLQVVRLDWDSLVPAVQTGQVDAVIAGQSMTAERAKEVDFAGPYFYASIVCLTKKDSKFANAKSIDDLKGGTCTSQLETIWYEKCLPQIKDAKIQTASETAPAMLMALETGTVDFVCTDMPTAKAAVIAYPDMKILNFSNSSKNFKVSDEDINIGISVRKGNTELKDAINKVVQKMSKDDFNTMMDKAAKNQPVTKES